MPTTLEDVRETLTGQPRLRWLPWRRNPTLAERVGDVTGQVSQTASDIAGQVSQTTSELAGQVGQTTSDLLERARGKTADLTRRSSEQAAPAVTGAPRRAAFELGRMAGRLSARPSRGVMMPQSLPAGLFEDGVSLPGRGYEALVSRADLSAERAASAAEAAAQAAQSAAGMMERLGGWVALLATRAAPPTPVQPSQAVTPEAALAAALRQEGGKEGKGVTEALRRAAMMVGQRVSDLSDGRYGLETQPPRAETKQEKKAAKRLERRAQREAKEEQPGAGVSWLPWVLGLSLGLVIGLAGVAYWQRRRLQDMWEQTSRRMQQATEGMRQRMETSRSQPQTVQTDIPTATPGFTPLGSAAPVTDLEQQTNGRMEPTQP